MFEKVGGYIRKYDGAKYPVSIHSNEKYDFFLIELNIFLC